MSERLSEASALYTNILRIDSSHSSKDSLGIQGSNNHKISLENYLTIRDYKMSDKIPRPFHKVQIFDLYCRYWLTVGKSYLRVCYRF